MSTDGLGIVGKAAPAHSNVTADEPGGGVSRGDAQAVVPTGQPRRQDWRRVLYPEEILAIALVIVTVGVNVAIHHTLNMNILLATVNTYRVLFNIHIHEFGRALKYFATAYIAWEFLRFVIGRPVQLMEWRRTGKLWIVARTLPTYFLCGAAFGNLSSFIHRLSPIDRDQWLIATDRIIGLGHDPIKLLEPLVTSGRVSFFIQVYLSLYLVPWFAMMVFVSQGKLRAFRDQVLAWWLALTIGWSGYLLLPAIGPQYTLRDTYVRPVFAVETMLARGIDRLPRDAFPSLHTGFSVTVLIMIWRHTTGWFYRTVFTIWVAGIVFSTMFLRIHYATDVAAGIPLAFLAAWLARRINDWYVVQAPAAAKPATGVVEATGVVSTS